jgi:hypothetical protein
VPASPSSELGGLQCMGTSAGTAGLVGGQAANSAAVDRFSNPTQWLCFVRQLLPGDLLPAHYVLHPHSSVQVR